jgi:hypothetical protein
MRDVDLESVLAEIEDVRLDEQAKRLRLQG